jgi:DNA excision repair protein ERCC-2
LGILLAARFPIKIKRAGALFLLMAKKQAEERFLFPYDKIRDVQRELMERVNEALEGGKNLIVHAPTGLGKTVAALCPALLVGQKEKLTIFFLTSRHTQHFIAIDTLREIRQKFGTKIIATDIVGKRWMCPVPGIETLYSGDFADYCNSVRDEGKCEFFLKTKRGQKLTKEAELVLSRVIEESPCHSERVMELCNEHRLCPYELSTELAKASSVVIADYYYIFNHHIRKLFFKKAEKSIESTIIIVDEGHNLPSRLRNLMTERLSTFMIDNAIKETRKFGYDETGSNLRRLGEILRALSKKIEKGEEILVAKEEFKRRVEESANYDELVADLEFVGNAIRESDKQSHTASIAHFLEAWVGEDRGFVRILSRKMGKREIITLSYRCLDPGLVSREVIGQSHSTIMMSGTLTPLEMYKDILGFEKAELAEFGSPFPKENRLNLLVPMTTTKFTERSEAQFKKIGGICADIVNTIPGNIILFFPSYYMRDMINRYFGQDCKKTTFTEEPNLNKDEKKGLLERFKSYSNTGAVLLATVSGSFGEGIDLPGDYLNAVVVVGLPLSVPDLETKALINYYDEKFSKGWDYGYVFPAMNKVMQNAGRVIRSETDRGAAIFLDERYSWQQYKRCFPKDWDIVSTVLYKKRLEEFFGQRK